jgi:hypothetical protein
VIGEKRRATNASTTPPYFRLSLLGPTLMREAGAVAVSIQGGAKRTGLLDGRLAVGLLEIMGAGGSGQLGPSRTLELVGVVVSGLGVAETGFWKGGQTLYSDWYTTKSSALYCSSKSLRTAQSSNLPAS